MKLSKCVLTIYILKQHNMDKYSNVKKGTIFQTPDEGTSIDHEFLWHC